jgi:phospholysine phosphohistidine inorganic pyrophosphate phosphatase
MTSPRGILFDLDGVVYNGATPIPGAAETIAWARANRVPFLFVTNTTSRPRQALVDKLVAMGIAATTEDIWTPAVAASLWLKDQEVEPVALFVPPATADEFRNLATTDSHPTAVVIGDLGEAWDFATLNQAFRMLHANPETILVALGMTRYWMSESGPMLDVAPFVAALELATNRKAVVLGKPAQEFFDAASLKLGIPTKSLLMIGDDIRADVGGAQHAGLHGALVRTGKFKPSDLDGDIRPALVLDSVVDLPAWWARTNN